MRWIGLGLDKLLTDKQLDLFQDALPGNTHCLGDLWDVRRLWSHCNGSKHLPAGASQSVRLREVITPLNKLTVQPENG